MNKLTSAQMRVFQKASSAGRVHAAGGFSDTPIDEPIQNSEFDTRYLIEKLINMWFLEYGQGWNQYVLTNAGREQVDAQAAD